MTNQKRFGRSTYLIAWDYVLTTPNDADADMQAINLRRRQMFPFDESSIGEMQFGLHHEVILGLKLIDIRTVLEQKHDEEIKRKIDIDATDAWGRTPLHLACLKADPRTVKTLLVSGADASKTADSKIDALMFACRGGNEACIVHLLKAGAKADMTTRNGRSALHFLAMHGHDHPSMMKLLIERGGKLNTTDSDQGHSILMLAALCNSSRITAYLIKRGAAIHHKGPDGASALHCSIQAASPACLVLLLEAGGEYQKPLADRQPFLHCVAQVAGAKPNASSIETLEVLTQWGLCGLDTQESSRARRP